MHPVHGSRLRALGYHFHRVVRMQELKEHITQHMLHTVATLVLRNGFDIRVARLWRGCIVNIEEVRFIGGAEGGRTRIANAF